MWRYLLVITAGVLVAVVSARRQFTLITVTGDSMMPALVPGDRVLVRRARAGRIRCGQVVVLEIPDADGRWTDPPHRTSRECAWMIKRVAALPGDPQPTDCLPATAASAGDLVPPGQLVVLGDNAPWSRDSRQFGYVPAQRLLGVVVSHLGERQINHYRSRRPLTRSVTPEGGGRVRRA